MQEKDRLIASLEAAENRVKRVGRTSGIGATNGSIAQNKSNGPSLHQRLFF